MRVSMKENVSSLLSRSSTFSSALKVFCLLAILRPKFAIRILSLVDGPLRALAAKTRPDKISSRFSLYFLSDITRFLAA